ncbi:basic salivary proline-rich protein 4-like [Chamaea fasciata]|uniref:basic salivary proline-rich protein 4-like n=1 Tax=Chamaea fasciata TaxID=190680 RepID=UPI003369EE41
MLGDGGTGRGSPVASPAAVPARFSGRLAETGAAPGQQRPGGASGEARGEPGSGSSLCPWRPSGLGVCGTRDTGGGSAAAGSRRGAHAPDRDTRGPVGTSRGTGGGRRVGGSPGPDSDRCQQRLPRRARPPSPPVRRGAHLHASLTATGGRGPGPPLGGSAPLPPALPRRAGAGAEPSRAEPNRAEPIPADPSDPSRAVVWGKEQDRDKKSATLILSPLSTAQARDPAWDPSSPNLLTCTVLSRHMGVAIDSRDPQSPPPLDGEAQGPKSSISPLLTGDPPALQGRASWGASGTHPLCGTEPCQPPGLPPPMLDN